MKQSQYNQVVRVAVTNNFNCTPKEWDQLDHYQAMFPEKYFFINANIKTPKLHTINDHPYQAVITLNPDLTPEDAHFQKLRALDPAKVGFVRLKWLPDNDDIREQLTRLTLDNYTVVLTLQRFHKTESLLKWGMLENYKHSCNNFWLAGEALSTVQKLSESYLDEGDQVHICDKKGLGCGGCGLCAKLTLGEDLKLSTLNLSSSGICPYNCPSCYAKRMQKRAVQWGNRPILFDRIKQNAKQRGSLVHITRIKELLKV